MFKVPQTSIQTHVKTLPTSPPLYALAQGQDQDDPALALPTPSLRNEWQVAVKDRVLQSGAGLWKAVWRVRRCAAVDDCSSCVPRPVTFLLPPRRCTNEPRTEMPTDVPQLRRLVERGLRPLGATTIPGGTREVSPENVIRLPVKGSSMTSHITPYNGSSSLLARPHFGTRSPGRTDTRCP